MLWSYRECHLLLAAAPASGESNRRKASATAQLGISDNAVLLSKSRVLKRLRVEAAGMLD
jgi:hypothetical protein